MAVRFLNGIDFEITSLDASVITSGTLDVHRLPDLSGTYATASHTQAWSTITSTPTTLAGYGITDAASSTHNHDGQYTRKFYFNIGSSGGTLRYIKLFTTSQFDDGVIGILSSGGDYGDPTRASYQIHVGTRTSIDATVFQLSQGGIADDFTFYYRDNGSGQYEIWCRAADYNYTGQTEFVLLSDYGDVTYNFDSVTTTAPSSLVPISKYGIWHGGNFNPSNYLLTTGKAADSNLLDGIDSGSFLRSDAADSYNATITATGSDWYLWSLGARGASAGAYGIGNGSADSKRQLTFHVPNQAAYGGAGTLPSFGWYSNGSDELMKLTSATGDLWVKGYTSADAGIFSNDASSRVLYLRGTGNIIQFEDSDTTKRWEVVGRNGTFYIYKNYGTGSGYKYQIDDAGNHTITGNLFSTDDLIVGATSERHYLTIKSSQWPEIRYETPTDAETIRLGQAHADNSTYSVASGDWYVYSSTNDDMRLIVPKGAESLKTQRSNTTYTIWDSGNLVNVSQLSNDSDYSTRTWVTDWVTQQEYLTDIPSALTLTSATIGGVKLEAASDRPGLLELNRDGTNTWSGLMTKFSGTSEWALMGHETQFGLYDDENNEWAWIYTKNGSLEMRHNGTTRISTTSSGAKVLNTLELGNYSDTNQGILLLNGSTANKQAKIQCTNGNLHIDANDGNNLYLNYYTGGTTSNIIFGNGNTGESGAKVTSGGVIYATGGNSGNWNTAYGWGNHASAGYAPIERPVFIGDVIPSTDRTQLLGRDDRRWQIVFCEILDSAGQHEKNLQNPEGEKQISEYETGTVLVWKGGKNVPCTTAADHMRMGIAVKGIDSPLIQGAEPVLVTGAVKEGDYLVTSSKKEGHAEAISPEFMRQHNLFDCVLGKALESAEGESHLVKTWINI